MAKRTRRTSRTSRKRSKTMFPLSQLQQSQTARIAKKVVMRNSETKRSNYHWNESEQNTATLDAQEMTLIAQGDEINNRTGRQILGQGITVKGCIHNNSNLEPVVVKMWVLQAKPGNTEDITTSTAMFVKARVVKLSMFLVLEADCQTGPTDGGRSGSSSRRGSRGVRSSLSTSLTKVVKQKKRSDGTHWWAFLK